MIDPEAADDCRARRNRPGVFGKDAGEKLLAARPAQARELRAVPEKRFVGFALHPARVGAERKLVIAAGRHAPDDAAAGRVRGHIELVQGRRLDIARRIHRAESAAELSGLVRRR